MDTIQSLQDALEGIGYCPSNTAALLEAGAERAITLMFLLTRCASSFASSLEFENDLNLPFATTRVLKLLRPLTSPMGLLTYASSLGLLCSRAYYSYFALALDSPSITS